MKNKLDTLKNEDNLKIDDKWIEKKIWVLDFKKFFQCLISNILRYTILRKDLPEEKIISKDIPEIWDEWFSDFIQKEIRLVLLNDKILLKNIKKLNFHKDLYKINILIWETLKNGYFYFKDINTCQYFDTLREYKLFIIKQKKENNYFDNLKNTEFSF